MSKWVVDTCVIIDVLSGDGGLRPVDITDLRKEEDDLSNAAKQAFLKIWYNVAVFICA